MTLPREARDGLSRVWLEILKEKHPGVSWVLMNEQQEFAQGEEPSTTEDHPVAA